AVRNSAFVDPQEAGHFGTMLGNFEIASAEKVRGIAEEPRAHRVALTGDRIGPGPRPADVAGHERQIDQALRGPHAFVTLVDTHRPPDGDAFPLADPAGQLVEPFAGNAARLG